MGELLKKVIEITQEYLGPASERFIRRQITGHLKTTPESLSSEHLEELANWVYISAKLIIEEEKAKELSEKIRVLK